MPSTALAAASPRRSRSSCHMASSRLPPSASALAGALASSVSSASEVMPAAISCACTSTELTDVDPRAALAELLLPLLLRRLGL